MRLFIIVLISVIVVSAVAFFSMPAIKEIRRSRAIEDEINNLKKEADKISAENGFLKEQVDYLSSDHYKERLAKDKLNLRNPGEQVVVVQPSTREDSINQAQEEVGELNNIKEDTSNFQKWWRYFFKQNING